MKYHRLISALVAPFFQISIIYLHLDYEIRFHSCFGCCVGLCETSQTGSSPRTFPPTIPHVIRPSYPIDVSTTDTFLKTNNPLGIVDVVFGLLGDAAAAGGAGKVTDLDCLQQITADSTPFSTQY